MADAPSIAVVAEYRSHSAFSSQTDGMLKALIEWPIEDDWL
ncbi:hypothetical protein RFM99_33270 [Mesorhizobium sp. VK4C]|nr:hypothetical protein [Mesorhizobium sp. VK4C]MDX8503229.1 hypothetical protein [Mesorhizobium sp. VK4C]